MLATDGQSKSYAIYLYADDMIQWTTGDNDGGVNGLGGTPAWAGIAYESDLLSIGDSRTNDVINIDQRTNIPGLGNPNSKGVYVIRISDGVVNTSE